ncbi:hypothetical protein TcasGA2_TC032485 [Tribolium castaneum]|uniref:Uncharacterized protein n=1 Tax=Tribolium castaneum TaxID=7070 RepID=A0A139WL36_TRICA|nr:hypothetical protein TcasGA2_TC032485 [Tribolium castaneum]
MTRITPIRINRKWQRLWKRVIFCGFDSDCLPCK